MIRRSIEAVEDRPWEVAALGGQLRQLAAETGDRVALETSLLLYDRAVALEPGSSTLSHDRGATYFAAGDDEAALAALERACELAPGSPVFPDRLAIMLEQVGRGEDAAAWREEAARRRGT